MGTIRFWYLFATKRIFSFFSQIFLLPPRRFVSSRSQGEYDLIFSRLNLLPMSGRISRRRTTPWAEITSRSNPLFLPFDETSVSLPSSSVYDRPYMCFRRGAVSFFAKPVTFLYRFLPRPIGWLHGSRAIHKTNELPTHERSLMRKEGQWIHLKREYDYLFVEG